MQKSRRKFKDRLWTSCARSREAADEITTPNIKDSHTLTSENWIQMKACKKQYTTMNTTLYIPHSLSSCCCIFILYLEICLELQILEQNPTEGRHIYTNLTPHTLQAVSLCSWLDWKHSSISSCTTGEKRKQSGQKWLWLQLSTFQHAISI